MGSNRAVTGRAGASCHLAEAASPHRFTGARQSTSASVAAVRVEAKLRILRNGVVADSSLVSSGKNVDVDGQIGLISTPG